jgi:hypothetical protein
VSRPAAQPLPDPPFYFPLRHGRYDVAPGLTKFGKALGGQDADAHVFQIDRTFDLFRAAKLASRSQRFDRYVRAYDLSDDVARDVGSFIARRLAAEHPDRFTLHGAGDAAQLRSALTGDDVSLDRGAATLDALACQVQEDLAIVRTAPGRHWLSYAHVCLPNGWAPAEKIGRSFAAVHEPVAGMADMNRRGDEFVNVMVRATEGLVRFAWGVTFDDRLNHHPDEPHTVFDPNAPRAFLRVERQTMWGFPHVGAALFTIRAYLYDFADLRRDPATREPLVNALRTMPPASQVYKGIAPHADALVEWLSSS